MSNASQFLLANQQGQHPVQNGVQMAQQSLTNDDDRKRAMGMAIMRFAQGMSSPAPYGGMSGKLANLNQSVLPAFETYGQSLGQAENSRYKSALLSQKEKELERRIRMDEEKLNLMREKDRRTYDLMKERNAIARDKSKKSKNGEGALDVLETPEGAIDVSNFPAIPTKGAQSKISNQLTGFNRAFREIEHIKKEFDELLDSTKENFFSPIPGGSLLGGIPNKAKDIANVVSPSDEVAMRELLFARLEKLQPVLESSLKGSAAGEAMMKRFHDKKAFPDRRQAPNVLAKNINTIFSELQKEKKLAEYSLKSGRIISDLPEEYLDMGAAEKKSKKKEESHEDDFSSKSTEELLRELQS
jgi:hypothetical protein